MPMKSFNVSVAGSADEGSAFGFTSRADIQIRDSDGIKR